MSGVATNDSSVLCDVYNDDDTGLHSRYGPTVRGGPVTGAGDREDRTATPAPRLRHKE